MYENIRVSDADRERVAERLREHYAAGRLSADELDERISAALSAKTFGDLRAVLIDLPEPGPIGPEGWPPQGMPAPMPRPAQPPAYAYRRGPRLMPIVLVALIAIVLLHGAGFVVAAFFNVILVMFVIAMVALIAGAARFRRHARRHWQSGSDGRSHWHHYEWHQ
jgi:hypothetical protein